MPAAHRHVLVEHRRPVARYSPIISLSKLVMASPGRPEPSKSADIDAHAGARLAVGAERQPGFDGDVLERAVAQVAIELVRLRVVGDEQIGPAVLVVVEHRDAERFRAGVEDAARRRDVFEGAVAAVAKQPAGVAAIRLRRAVRLLLAVEAAEHVVLGRPLDVVADEQIEQAVAIEVEPQRRRAERRSRPPRPLALRDVDERALAGIAEQPVLADAGDEEIGKAVVVAVADGDAHPVHLDVEAGGARHVGERAVAVVAVEAQRRPLAACGPASPCR